MKILLQIISLFIISSVGAAEIIDLGDLGRNQTSAYAMNNLRQVTGTSWSPSGTHSFLWNQGTIHDLYPLNSQDQITVGPTGINDLGQIASGVVAKDGRYYPAIYDHGNIEILGSLGGNRTFTGAATAINNSGVAVGYSYINSSVAHGFIYNGVMMQDLGCLPESRQGCRSFASDINDSGQIVGQGKSIGSTVTYALLWENGTVTNISPFGANWATAVAINGKGQVTGYFTDGQFSQSFIYPDGVQFGILDAYANDINDSGVVVGSMTVCPSRHCENFHAFIYNGSLVDLNDLLPPGSGWELTFAFSINNNGDIVGVGRKGGAQRAFLFIP